MLSEKECRRLLEISKEIESAVSTSIKIDHNQVMDIVVADLFAKYKSAWDRKDNETWMNFRKVLLFYLTEDELAKLMESDDD